MSIAISGKYKLLFDEKEYDVILDIEDNAETDTNNFGYK